MGYVRVASNLTLDNAHCDGHITTLGVGRNWPAAEPRITGARAMDLDGAYGWDYGTEGELEYIPALKGIAPAGIAPLPDMSPLDWTVQDANMETVPWLDAGCRWTQSPIVGRFEGQHWFHMFDGTPGLLSDEKYQTITSNSDFTPNLCLRMWLMPAAEGETDPVAFAIVFLGDGEQPVYAIKVPRRALSEEAHVGLLPAEKRRARRPSLWGRPQGESEFAFIDDFTSTGAGMKDQESTAHYQVIWIEYVDGWLLVNFLNRERTWAYRAPWISGEGDEVDFTLCPGPIRILMSGQTAYVNVAQMQYPTTPVIMRATKYLYVPERVAKTPYYRRIAHLPEGTDVQVAWEQGGDSENHRRPVVTFTADADSQRAVLYNVQEFRYPTIGNATSNPVQSQGNADMQLLDISGSLNSRWREARMRATLEAQPGHTLPEIKPNMKARGEISTDGGATYHTQHTGYVVPPEKHRGGGVAPTTAELESADWIGARGRNKAMHWQCSYEGWPVDEAFRYVLHRAGVADSLIDVSGYISEEYMKSDYYLPISEVKGQRLLDFEPSVGIVEGLDTIVGSCGVRWPEEENWSGIRWGVDQNGKLFLYPNYHHTPGFYDFTLDDDTTTEEDIVFSFRGLRSVDEFANIIVLLVDRGSEIGVRTMCDWASIEDSTDPRFIGDHWLHVEHYQDAVNIGVLAEQLCQRRLELSHLLYGELHDHPELLPDDELRVQMPEVDVAMDSIFRIDRKGWRTPRGRYEQTLEAAIVEEG